MPIIVKQHTRKNKSSATVVKKHLRSKNKMVLINGVWHKAVGGLLVPTRRKVGKKKEKFKGAILSDADYSKNPDFDKLSETMNPTEIALAYKGEYAKAIKHGIRYKSRKSRK